jgi:filamentous hemagglutinin
MNRVARSILLCAVSQALCAVRAAPPAPTQLPVPCQAGACGTNAKFVTSGAATAVAAGANLTVHQSSSSATLNWASFNIGSSGNVVFQQPSSSAVALNRIYDANPSSIFGSLSANGQIYLVNANGFLFGAHSVLNVAGLIASSLNITDSTFTNGILAPVQNSRPALEQFTLNSQNFAVDGPAGSQIPNVGSITVQNGAELTATDGGRLLLAAPTVQNYGSLSAPDGQIVLAAGQNVFLQASDDNSLRGLIVQVDAGTTAASQLTTGVFTTGVYNGATGVLSAPRGNITLAGLMINQDGRISATTSVSANGSVTLTAGTNPTTTTTPLSESQGGEVVLGPNSNIDVLPELSDAATAVDAQVQLPSTISITGEQVFMQGSIVAPSGHLTVTATSDPSAGVGTGGDDPAARLRIEPGMTIDLAGSDATLPMAANLVTVQLRSNEFANDPTQRNGALRGDTVTVDVRADGGAGTPIADVASAIAAVGETIAQRTETGGKAIFQSEGDIVFSPTASINVSGGATTYLAGTIQTTKLVGANGQIYDIGSASPLITYAGIINPTLTQTYDKWGVQEVVPTPGLSQYEPTYLQGASAGTLQFTAPSMALGGSLIATAITGPYQRGSVLGGTLIVGTLGSGGNGPPQNDYFAPPIELTVHPTPLVVGDDAALPVQTLQLPSAYLTSDGFTNVQLATNTTFELPAGLPLQLPAGMSLSVQASLIEVNSSITALGGSLSFQNELTSSVPIFPAPAGAPGYPRPGISLGDGVTLDVSGLWTNDSFLTGGVGSAATLPNGGTINLQLTLPGSELVLGNDVALKANGGAWNQNSGTMTYGTGGSLTLDASPSQAAIQFGQDTVVEASGAGTASGGSFTLLAPRIEISQGAGSAWTEAQRVDDLNPQGQVLNLYAPLFSDFGFSNISLTATGPVESTLTSDVLTVEAAANPYLLQTRTLELDPGVYELQPSGGTIAAFSQPALLLPYQQPVTNLSLNALRLGDDIALGSTAYGSIDVKPGATISGEEGASISIAGEGSISIGGTLRAPGGDVSVRLFSPLEVFDDTGLDPGYVADLGIDLTPTAVIDVSAGSAVMTPNNQGLLLGTVSGGGSVSIQADRGTVVVDAGSQIDFSGTSSLLDVPNSGTGMHTRETVATAGGSLTVGAAESIELLGTLRGGAGVGGAGTAAGGSLEIDLARSGSIPGQPNPDAPLRIELVASTPGLATPPVLDLATIGVAQILHGTGIDALTLNAGGSAPGLISIQTDEPIALGRSIVFESEILGLADGVTASIAAPYVEIGNPLTLLLNGATQPAPTAGTGTLTVAANQLTLVGNLTVQNISTLTLSSQGDVQLQGTALPGASGPETGSLSTAGNVTIQAERVYPDTYTSFTIQAQSLSGGTTNVTIDPILIDGRAVPSPGTPLSAGGAVSISADNIEVGGTLLAPFGEITLAANDSLKLADGSLVSVSGAGLDVPYGQTQLDGGQWIYETSSAYQNTITGVPTKAISLSAPNLTVQSKAVVDLQGGGDLYAYEWVPGTGGSVDSLAGSGTAQISGLYAIIPAQRGLAAPYDPEESGGFNAAQTVYLSGGAGIAPGYYALLPPRYGLAPGALLIQLEPSYSSASGGQIGALGNGTPVIAGFLSSAGTTLYAGTTTYEGFAVYPSGYGQQLAAYTISQASSYFPAVAALNGTGTVPLPADAGVLSISVVASSSSTASTSLSLLGTVQTGAASGGRGATINISAPDLEVSTDGSTSSSSFVGISSTVLQSWNASELTLGGSVSADDSSATVAANRVTVDGGVSLTADQIFVLAQQDIDVQAGASLASTSGKNGTPLGTPPTAEPLTLSDPSAGFLAVSDLGLPIVARGGAGAGATVELAVGSRLSSGGALVLDSPGNMTLDGTLSGRGASWSLGSDSIAFVGSGTALPDTLNIDSSLVQSLQTAGSVRLASEGSIDLLVPVSLGASDGTPTLGSLTLLGTAINNERTGSSVFGAASVSLGGVNLPSGGSAPAFIPVVGNGTLSLVANTLNLTPNTTAISGFAATQLQVAGAVTSAPASAPAPTSGSTSTTTSAASQNPSGLNVAGNLTVDAVEITPGAGSQTTIATSGTLTIGTPTTLAKGTTLTTLVGGALTLQGSSITDDGAIAAPSGIVTLDATVGNLQIGSTGSINVAGTLLAAVDRTAASPGGTISLSAPGNVTLASGSTLSIAGEEVAPAGTLSIVGGGTVSLSGTLAGDAGSGGTGGNFSLSAGQLPQGLTTLASSLTRGGFSNSVGVEVSGGDLDLLSGGTLTANKITLTADSGTVDIAGVLSAPSAAQRGVIDLSGASVVLESGAGLYADGTAANPMGGEIELNAGDEIAPGATCASCSITLQPGSVITAVGGNQMGQLILRAPAVLATNDVAINTPASGITGLGANVTQAGQVIIEPVLSFATSNQTIDSDLPNDVAAASAYLSAASPVIAQRLANPATSLVSSTTPPVIQVGVELEDANPTDTLTLPGIDLSPYSLGQVTGQAQVINVAVRAAGSVAVNGTITDGFITDPTGNTDLIALSNAPSASFSIVAGANLASANLLSTQQGSAASLTLLSSSTPADGTTDGVGPSVVRTGTGDINLAAAGDIVFASGAGGAAAVYTGGLAPANVIGPVAYDNDATIMNFGTNGGNVRLVAGGNVVGAPVGVSFPGSDDGNFGVTGWLLHQGSLGYPAQYGADYGSFDWNVGALGGGDVTITAAANITNVSAAAADSLVSGANTLTGNPSLYGAGGGLSMSAGGDIGSAQIYVADGVGTLTAGGGLIPVRSLSQPGGPNGTTINTPVGSSIALDDSQISVWVRNGLQVDAIYNPTLANQLNAQGDSSLAGQYSTYGTNSAVNLSSTTASVSLNLSSSPQSSLGSLLGTGEVAAGGLYLIAPPTLSIQSLQGDILLSGTTTLAPSNDGQLSLFAALDIQGANSNASIAMSDAALATIATALNPALRGSLTAPFQGVLHVGDPSAALVTAGQDINTLELSIPKAAQILAGRDIVNLNYKGQNIAPTDVTLIAAGRDYESEGQEGGGIEVGGPGSVDVLSGRNLNLGFGGGVVTVGNIVNANLPTSQGANVNLMVGYGTQGADLTGFLNSIIVPSPTYQTQLINYVESLNGASGLSFAQAKADFVNLPSDQQSPLIDTVFFNELLLSGRAANSAAGVSAFQEGYAAIDALFPDSRSPSASAPSPYNGNLTLTSSQIYTDSGGNISILVPGGDINVGLANAPITIQQKPASSLGIVAEGSGNVDIYSLSDVNVNTSRIFTLGGGNILIWSTLGSIDAGNGSKSSLSVPPPTISVSITGQVTLNFGASLASGSGIRTIQTDPNAPPGDVDLDAPVGTVNAGDAGIGAAGNINIAAAHVIGVDNINFGGTASGVPSDLSSLGASLSGVSSAAAGTTTSSTSTAQETSTAAKETAPLAQTALSWLDVFVTGLGEENCKPDDIECLKRQKQAAP